MRFPYTAADNLLTSLMPRLPLDLHNGNHSVNVTGLLDTGSAVNVLPYSIGLALGAVWQAQTVSIPLVGALGRYDARALAVLASHPQLTGNHTVRLAFAWVQTDEAPVIFGQVNFFAEFDVCFFRSQGVFDVNLKGNA